MRVVDKLKMLVMFDLPSSGYSSQFMNLINISTW
jgi:hypothetical protein